MNMQDPKYQQKSISISSAEPNYFVHFAMRYPVAQEDQEGVATLMDKEIETHRSEGKALCCFKVKVASQLEEYFDT